MAWHSKSIIFQLIVNRNATKDDAAALSVDVLSRYEKGTTPASS
jgi:hypothetical protein